MEEFFLGFGYVSGAGFGLTALYFALKCLTHRFVGARLRDLEWSVEMQKIGMRNAAIDMDHLRKRVCSLEEKGKCSKK